MHCLPSSIQWHCYYPRSVRTFRKSLRGVSEARAEQNSSRPPESSKSGSYGRKFKQRPSSEVGPNIAAAYDMAVAEAQAMGIPDYALPRLSSEPTLQEAREAQEKIQSIIASFMSANI